MSLSVTPTPCVNFAAQVLNQHRQTLFKKSAHLVYVNMLCSHVNIHKLKLIFMFWGFFYYRWFDSACSALTHHRCFPCRELCRLSQVCVSRAWRLPGRTRTSHGVTGESVW